MYVAIWSRLKTFAPTFLDLCVLLTEHPPPLSCTLAKHLQTGLLHSSKLWHRERRKQVRRGVQVVISGYVGRLGGDEGSVLCVTRVDLSAVQRRWGRGADPALSRAGRNYSLRRIAGWGGSGSSGYVGRGGDFGGSG